MQRARSLINKLAQRQLRAPAECTARKRTKPRMRHRGGAGVTQRGGAGAALGRGRA